MATDALLEGSSQKPQKIFESTTVAKTPDGWITPTGTFYSCSPEEHDECANYLLKTQKKSIDSLLNERWQFQMVGDQASFNSREVLKAAGFALLSGNQLSETNLPETLTFRQMEFAKINNLVFMPKSGQLDLETYRSFQERAKNLKGVKKLLEHENRDLKEFLEDPTKAIDISDNDSLAEELLATLSEGSTGEISLKLSKGMVIWRRLDIPAKEDVFLEYHYHDHTGGGTWESFPETEASLLLTSKQGIKEYLNEKRSSERRDGTRFGSRSGGSDLEGDLSILE